MQCLQVFGDISRHRVSQDKTVIYFSLNVGNCTRREICTRSGFKPVELRRYLGAENAFPRRRKDKYKHIVEQVRRKLSGWKTSSLSIAGRLTLVKAITNSMAIYPMQHDRIPNGIIQEIERLQRNFVWGEDQGEKRWQPYKPLGSSSSGKVRKRVGFMWATGNEAKWFWLDIYLHKLECAFDLNLWGLIGILFIILVYIMCILCYRKLENIA